MSAFTEQLLCDLDSTFLQTKEFGELHTINGTVMVAIIDRDGLEQMKARSGYADNLFSVRMVLYVKAEEFGQRPAPESMVDVDHRKYRVISASGDTLYEIVLGANRG